MTSILVKTPDYKSMVFGQKLKISISQKVIPLES